MTKIFNHFWDLEYDESISYAFFTTRENNTSTAGSYFTLQEQPVPSELRSLPIIRDKMILKQYSVSKAKFEEFASDFRKMFANIMSNYPPTHAAHVKAAELAAAFEEMWAAETNLT